MRSKKISSTVRSAEKGVRDSTFKLNRHTVTRTGIAHIRPYMTEPSYLYREVFMLSHTTSQQFVTVNSGASAYC